MDKKTARITRYVSIGLFITAIILFAVTYDFKQILSTGFQVAGAYIFSWLVLAGLLYLIYLGKKR